jgi:hypothetical protein
MPSTLCSHGVNKGLETLPAHPDLTVHFSLRSARQSSAMAQEPAGDSMLLFQACFWLLTPAPDPKAGRASKCFSQRWERLVSSSLARRGGARAAIGR